MARATEREFTYERTVQLERFEPVRVGETILVQLEDGDDPEDVAREYDDLIRDSVERRLLRRIMQKKMAEGEAESDDAE